MAVFLVIVASTSAWADDNGSPPAAPATSTATTPTASPTARPASPATAPAPSLPPFTADRPGYSEGASVVGQGVFQLEAGLQQEYHKRFQQQNYTYVDALLRLGLSRKLELRVEGNTFQRTQSFVPPATTWALNETSIGFKYQFQDQPDGSGRPSLGVTGRVFPSTGSNGLQSVHAQEDVQLVMDWSFAPHWQLTSNVGVGIFEDSRYRLFTSGLFTCALSRDISDSSGAFVEISFQTPEQAQGKNAWILDYGVRWMIGRDTQLDVSLGHGLGGVTAPDLFYAVGISQRWK